MLCSMFNVCEKVFLVWVVLCGIVVVLIFFLFVIKLMEFGIVDVKLLVLLIFMVIIGIVVL